MPKKVVAKDFNAYPILLGKLGSTNYDKIDDIGALTINIE
jgi:hypothetical protein